MTEQTVTPEAALRTADEFSTDQVLRDRIVTSGGDLDVLRELTKGDESAFESTRILYEKAKQEAGFVHHSFAEHDLSGELAAHLSEADVLHLAWQMAADARYRKFIVQESSRFTGGPVATRLADSLLMAAKLPKIIPESEHGLWVDAGSGTGMAAIPMAAMGRNITGIEKVRTHVSRAIVNQHDIEKLTGRSFPVRFIEATLPEGNGQPIDETSSHILREADIWYCYPWAHEIDERFGLSRIQLFKRFSKKDARLILYTAEDPVTFTVPEIEAKGLSPMKLSNGEYSEDLGYPYPSLWTVWRK